MEINTGAIKEVLDELFSLLEGMETKNGALLDFLKDKKITTDKKLAPYLERAANASSVRWRAARVRMEFLLSPAQKKKEDEAKDNMKREDEKAGGENKPQEKAKGRNKNEDKANSENVDGEKNNFRNPNRNDQTAET